MMPTLKAPFPYFGGKSAVAAQVWARLGDVHNYVEPFCGSCAVLLARPAPPKIETVNDINSHLANFWRALQHDPDAVARHADYPVSELDLHARGDWLFYRPGMAEWTERFRVDPEFYDAKSAGWWVWGLCSWIGDGWGGRAAGQGVNRKRPHLGAGQGVNRQLPHLGDAGRGDVEPPFVTSRTHQLIEYFRQLAERLRGVRVCCGDWTRVCGPITTFLNGMTGAFLDPPYAVADRDSVYGEHEDFQVAHAVREWAITNGQNPLMRIALCDYDEHKMPAGWTQFAWKTKGGFGAQRKRGINNNPSRETIWFSPHCLNPHGDFLSGLEQAE